MKKLALLLLALSIPATAALAQDPMSAEEFDAYSVGRTLTYAESGTIYGVEEYLPGRRVRWAYTADECREGYWYEDGPDICFVYEHDMVPQCWQFFQEERGLRAKFMGAEEGREAGRELYEAQKTDKPLACLGPNVGV